MMELTLNNVLNVDYGNLGRRTVWHHFHRSTVNAFGDRGNCWVLAL